MLPAGALSQSRPAFDSFEVATIKPTPPDWTGGRYIRMQTAHQLVARSHTLKTFVAAAFNVSPQVISGGSAWVSSDHFAGDRPVVDQTGLVEDTTSISNGRQTRASSVV